MRTTTLLIYAAFFYCIAANANAYLTTDSDTIFYDNFESGSLDALFWRTHSSTAEGVVEVSSDLLGDQTAQEGAFAVAIGKSEGNTYNVNHLDLQLSLAAYADIDLLLEFWIKDLYEDNTINDLLLFSNDGGLTFVPALQFYPQNWTDNAYGKFPPIHINQLAKQQGLELTDQFVIRFQQAGTHNLTSYYKDGFFLDEVLVRKNSVTYATLPFEDGFESGKLEYSWQWASVPSKGSINSLVEVVDWDFASPTGMYGLAIGNRYQGIYTKSAIDLHLNLADYDEVSLSFDLADRSDQTNDADGIWISDDAGKSFHRIYQFDPNNYRDHEFQNFQFDLDSLAFDLDLSLSETFIVRFQNGAEQAFLSYYKDGLLLDNVKVTGTKIEAAPKIKSFAPLKGQTGETITVTGENFTPNTQVSFGGIVSQEVTVQNSQTIKVIVPPLASTGKLKITTSAGRTTSQTAFEVLGSAVIFHEDFESGTLRSIWQTGSSTGQGHIAPDRNHALNGFYGLALGKSEGNAYNLSHLDLHIPLAEHAEKDLLLDFWIKDLSDDNHSDDLLQFSDDGGVSFISVLRLYPEGWVDNAYGRFPPIDIDALAKQYGLVLNDQFVIRFQQAGTQNITGYYKDGFFLDDITIREENTVYAQLPYVEDFESGRLNKAWKWSYAPATGQINSLVEVVDWRFARYTGLHGLAIGNRYGNVYTKNAADLHLNLVDYEEVTLEFMMADRVDNYHDDDGIWASDDGGKSFKKMFQFESQNYRDHQFQTFTLDIDSLAFNLGLSLSETFVIRFQNAANTAFFDYYADGYLIDDLSVKGAKKDNGPKILSFSPKQGRVGDKLILEGKNFTTATQVKIGNVSTEEVSIIDDETLEISVPLLATTGKISVSNEYGKMVSSDAYTILGREVIFFEDFETATLRSMWETGSSTGQGYIAIDRNHARTGFYGLALGKNEGDTYNISYLDLHIPLAAHADKSLLLEFWIKDLSDNNDADDFLAFSDDGGATFTPVLKFNPEGWVDNAYGRFPPIDINVLAHQYGLVLNDNFVIRFQQAGASNFTSYYKDGFFLDDISIRAREVIYADLPYADGFESTNLSPAWQWSYVPSAGQINSFVEVVDWNVAHQTGLYGLAIGNRYGSVRTNNAADLHLNLSNYDEVNLSFAMTDRADNNHTEDAIWVSDDGGNTFEKMFQFEPQNYRDNQFQTFTLDLDSLVFDLGLSLSETFVIRFQNTADNNFFDYYADGFLIDDIKVTGTTINNTPSIVDFSPQKGRSGTEVTIKGEHFTSNTRVKIGNVESESTQFINTQTLKTIVPTLATSGKISVENGLGKAASKNRFQVLGREVLFFENFETGQIRSMWRAASSTPQGYIAIDRNNQLNGFYGLAMGKSHGNDLNVNSFDLHIPLAAFANDDLLLEFWIKDLGDNNQLEDLLAFSDDGGNTFTNVLTFYPENWVDNAYGRFPPIDIDELAKANGLELNDEFVIRFQQAGTGTFTSYYKDGFFLDDILIRKENTIYADLPFEDGFESGRLSDVWKWKELSAIGQINSFVQVVDWELAHHSGLYGLAVGNRYGRVFTNNAAELYLNLSGYSDITLEFQLSDRADNNHEEDAIMVSDDGGQTFKELFQFEPQSYRDNQFQQFSFDLDSLVLDLGMSLSETFVIRFQNGAEYNFFDYYADGFFIDDVKVNGTRLDDAPSIISLTPSIGYSGQTIQIKGLNLENASQVKFNGKRATYSIQDGNMIEAKVPVGATTGRVSVITPSDTAYSAYNFVVTAAQDLAITQIISPSTGCELSNEELVTIEVRNLGQSTAENMQVAYTLDNRNRVVEQIPTAIPADSAVTYTFQQTVNLSNETTYDLAAFLVNNNDENVSNDRTEIEVEHYPSFQSSISGEPFLCAGEQTILTVSGGISYLWDNGSRESSIRVFPNQTTTYTVTVTNENGCTNEEQHTVEMPDFPKPEITVVGNTVLCPGTTTQLVANIKDNIQWSTGANTPEIEVSQGGYYRFTYVDESGCTAVSDYILIQEARPITIYARKQARICEGDTEFLQVYGATSVLWSTGETTNTIEVQPDETQTYHISTFDAYGCEYMDTLTVEVIPYIEPNAPDNLLPQDGLFISQPPINFSWSPAPNATHYDFYFWKVGEERPTRPYLQNTPQIQFNYRNRLEYGSSYQWQVVPKNECAIGTPSVAQKIIVEAAADLEVTNINVPANAFSGTQIELEWTVQNKAEGSTRNAVWYDYVYFSEDAQLDHTDRWVGGLRNPSALEPNQTYRNKLTYQLPKGLSGDYYLIVTTNSSQWIQESNYQNNTSTQVFKIQLTPAPDLKVTGGVLPGVDGTIFSGIKDQLRFTVKNQGQGPTEASRWWDQVLLSTDSILLNTRNAYFLGRYSHEGNLEVGESYEVIEEIQIPERLSGKYFIHVQTDQYNAEYEYLFEENNFTNLGVINIIETPAPDLSASNITSVKEVSNNEQVRVHTSEINYGVATEGAYYNSLYISDTSNFSGYHQRLATLYQSELLATNASSSRWFDVSIPKHISGKYYLIFKTDDYNQIYEASREDNNTMFMDILIQHPDLKVSTPDFSGNPTAGRPLNIEWTMENIGAGDLINQTLLEEVFLSTDTMLNIYEDQLLSRTYTPATLQTDGRLTKQVEVTLPEGLEGEYYLFVQLNRDRRVYENNQLSNNISTPSAISINSGNYPDLVVTTVKPNKDTLNVREFFDVQLEVENQSAVELLESWKEVLYVSNSPTWLGYYNAIPLKNINRSQQVEANGSYEDAITVQIPSYLNSGEYYLYYLTDALDQVFEIEEQNNVLRSVPIIVERKEAGVDQTVDLSITDLRIPTSITFDQADRLFWSVTNYGNHQTYIDTWTDGLYLSRDLNWNPEEDQLLHQWKRNASLFSGRTYTKIEQFTIPSGLTGEFYILLVTDDQQLTQDRNRRNNVRVFQLSEDEDDDPIVVDYPPLPNLVLDTIILPDMAIAGQPFEVYYTVSNTANIDISARRIDRLRLATNPTYGGVSIASRQQNRLLKSQESYTDTLRGTLPIDATGNYFIRLNTDDYNNIKEEKEDDNAKVLAIEVTQSPPSDLVVNTVEAPTEVILGAAIDMSWRTENIGTNTARGQMQEGIYISKDSLIDSTDILLHTRSTYINLEENANMIQNATASVEGVTIGSYNLIVRTDLFNNFVELEEDNNTNISVEPILVKVPELPLETWLTSTLPQADAQYFRIEIASELEGESLQILLESEEESAINEIYLSYESIPSRANFEYAFETPFDPNQRIIAPNIKAGTYYLMVYGQGVNIQNTQLYAEIVEFELLDIQSNVGGNTGQVTTQIKGTRFEPNMQVWLQKGTNLKVPALQFQYQNGTTAFVRFDLTAARLGNYDLIAVNELGDTTTLINGFRVERSTITHSNDALSITCSLDDDFDAGGTDASNNGLAAFELQHPPSARPDRIVPITFRFENTSNIDIPLPYRVLSARDGIPIAASSEGIQNNEDELFVEFTEENGPKDVLRPGAVVYRTIYAKALRSLDRIYIAVKQ